MAAIEPSVSFLDDVSPRAAGEQSDAYWRSLHFFNTYRLFVALMLLTVIAVFGNSLTFGSLDQALFVYAAAAYLLFGIACLVWIGARRHFNLQLAAQVVADIGFITVLGYASGGVSSGLGLLLLASLAASGLVSRGKLTLFFAALASIAVLLEHTYQVLQHDGVTAQYVQAGLLSIGYFAIAIVAHQLAKYLVESERRAAQREIDIANLDQVNQLVIRDMQDGVLVVDPRGVIRQYNARAEAMLGAMPRGPVLLGQYAPRLAEYLQEWNVNPWAGFEPVSTMVLAQQINVRILPVGRIRRVGAVIFLEDLAQVREQARQMKLASLGRLTANIAHEIRNPLSAISHAAELLQEESIPNPVIGRLLAIISDNSQRLDKIVQDVLRLNRGERSQREAVKLADYLRAFVERFCQVEKIAPALFSLDVRTDLKVSFDRSNLDQVMWNLCGNALRHCRRTASSIRIAADSLATGNQVRLDVVDDGPGVAPAVRSSLFEPFFTTETGGTGLGLYIAREVCEANEASLDYVETPTGAQFTVLCKGG